MPRVATLACLLCIAWLFWIDRKQPDGVSRAVWVPVVWMLLAGSRFVSQWLNLAPPQVSVDGFSEGSPLDRNVFLALIIAALWILHSRKVGSDFLARRNAWILMFFGFAAISALWADDPALALKRWIKCLGNLVMALVIISERRPERALVFVVRRIAFVLLPLSVLLIKYYPDLGRQYHMGIPMFSGAALTKNALGQLCLIVGMCLVWESLYKAVPTRERLPLGVVAVLAPMTLWLLHMADSATSNVCLVLAILVLLVARLRVMRGRLVRVIGVGIAIGMAVAALETTFGIKDRIIVALGRRPDLTDRHEIWRIVLSMDTNPLIGVGYESFWTGQRALQVWEQLGVTGINQAHNGYVELYLNLGLIGLFLLAAGVLSGLVRTVNDSRGNYSYATFRLALIVVVVAYNLTEAMFIPISNMFVLLLVALFGARLNERRSVKAVARKPNRTWDSSRRGDRPA